MVLYYLIRRSKILIIKNVLTQTSTQAGIAQEWRHRGVGGGDGGGGGGEDGEGGGEERRRRKIHDFRVWVEQR